MQKTQVWSLGWEDPLENKMATYCSTLAWEIPWTEDPAGLQSMGATNQSPMTQWLSDYITKREPYTPCLCSCSLLPAPLSCLDAPQNRPPSSLLIPVRATSYTTVSIQSLHIIKALMKFRTYYPKLWQLGILNGFSWIKILRKVDAEISLWPTRFPYFPEIGHKTPVWEVL